MTTTRKSTRKLQRLDTQEQRLENLVEELGANMKAEIDSDIEVAGATNPIQESEDAVDLEHHLIFVIHGMGQRKAKFIENMRTLTELADSVSGKNVKFLFIPIEWHTKLHELPSVDARIKPITLNTVPFFRQLNNDYLADTLYYFTKFHAEKIMSLIVDEMHRQLEACRKKYKKIGAINMFGHSLGGVIAYDLLANQGMESKLDFKIPQLNFSPNCLFLVGCPVSAVLVMRGQTYDKYRLCPDIKVFNCFNPYDPIAYRLEPLIYEDDPNAVEGPVEIPRISLPSSTDSYSFSISTIFTNTIYSASSTIRILSDAVSSSDLLAQVISSPPSTSAPDSLPPIVEEETVPLDQKRKRDPERYDYLLQVNMFQNINNEYINGISAHFSYWTSLDLVNFICNKIKSKN